MTGRRGAFPHWSWIPLGLALVLYSWLWLDYENLWLDDAFISFRYARNLAAGLGPVFNPGEYVEGYTTFLWMLTNALAFALTDDTQALAWIKYSGWLLGIWTLIRTWTFPGPGGEPRRRPLVLILATHPIFIVNCGDGMETPLFMALVVECARSVARAPTPMSGLLSGLLTAGLVWTRPESLPLLVVLPALVFYAYRHEPQSRPLVNRWALAFLIGGLLPVAVHVGWRIAYYGHPFPNTFYAKATGDVWARLRAGFADLSHFSLIHTSGWPVAQWTALALALAGLWRSREPGSARPGRARAWLSVLCLMIGFRLAFDLWSGSEAMGVFRFLAPLLAPLFVLADEGARWLWGGRARAVIATAVLLSLAFNANGHRSLVERRARYADGLANAHMALGAWLRERHPEGTLVAIGDAGVVPFFSRLPVIDLWGLNDATIAQMPGEYGARPGVAEYALARRPGVIVLWNQVPYLGTPGQGQMLGAQRFDRAINDHPSFKASYRFVEEFTFRAQAGRRLGYYLDVFERKSGSGPRSRKGRRER